MALRPYREVGAWIVVGGLAAHPWTARVTPRNDTPATAMTRRVRGTAKNKDMMNRGTIFTALTNMGTGRSSGSQALDPGWMNFFSMEQRVPSRRGASREADVRDRRCPPPSEPPRLPVCDCRQDPDPCCRG